MNLAVDEYRSIFAEKGILGEEASKYYQGDGTVDQLCLLSQALVETSACRKCKMAHTSQTLTVIIVERGQLCSRTHFDLLSSFC